MAAEPTDDEVLFVPPRNYTDKEFEDMNDSQVNPESMEVKGPGVNESIIGEASSVTVPVEPVEPNGSDIPSEAVEPPVSPQPKEKTHKRARKAAEQKEPLIPNPPRVPEQVVAACEIAKSQALAKAKGEVLTSVESQRLLKKRLEQEEQDKKDEAKQEVQKKKQTAADKVEKLEAKLAKAQAKAKAIGEKKGKGKGGRRSVKRNLNTAFEAAAELPAAEGAAAPAAAPVVASPKPKRKSRSKEAVDGVVKLSPKAKSFAASTRSPMASKTSAGRANKAKQSLETLRGLEIPDLVLPNADFSKKKLSTILHTSVLACWFASFLNFGAEGCGSNKYQHA